MVRGVGALAWTGQHFILRLFTMSKFIITLTNEN